MEWERATAETAMKRDRPQREVTVMNPQKTRIRTEVEKPTRKYTSL